jgi:hypothetical protein
VAVRVEVPAWEVEVAVGHGKLRLKPVAVGVEVPAWEVEVEACGSGG